MRTEIIRDQSWARTGDISASLRSEFWGDFQFPLDAPRCSPSGSTVENIVRDVPGMEDVRGVIGGLVFLGR